MEGEALEERNHLQFLYALTWWGEECVMDEGIQRALARDRTMDITTTGRQSGQLRRTEIWFHYLDGNVYITGTPGRRDWYANLLASPVFTFHLKQTAQADLSARATPILEPTPRREILARIHQNVGGRRDLEAWVADSPLVQVVFLMELPRRRVMGPWRMPPARLALRWEV